jgi:hypothetical protein
MLFLVPADSLFPLCNTIALTWININLRCDGLARKQGCEQDPHP